ncbi:hypothetical protein NPIL_122521 [Nephila pilipes]|uniref:Uncharacterized protein n=1 Tax=Nephila pilipes TaxID=299642 RepID=A0A8X6P307_NEPPI|nr:hypothetical protein NPIL_122521 [Nephila pilipes]
MEFYILPPFLIFLLSFKLINPEETILGLFLKPFKNVIIAPLSRVNRLRNSTQLIRSSCGSFENRSFEPQNCKEVCRALMNCLPGIAEESLTTDLQSMPEWESLFGLDSYEKTLLKFR